MEIRCLRAYGRCITRRAGLAMLTQVPPVNGAWSREATVYPPQRVVLLLQKQDILRLRLVKILLVLGRCLRWCGRHNRSLARNSSWVSAAAIQFLLEPINQAGILY